MAAGGPGIRLLASAVSNAPFSCALMTAHVWIIDCMSLLNSAYRGDSPNDVV